MKLHTINAGNFKLDGGAMFGVVPKSIWKNLNEADANNMCNWATRCLLVEDGDRLMLIDNGMGEKQSEKFFSYYFLNGDDSLDKSLNAAGFSRSDVTDVFLTHLHFDHCGGSIQWNKDKTFYEPAFSNAIYWSQQDHWNHALNPNAREKASFLAENIKPIEESGQLKFIGSDLKLSENIKIKLVNGHTESMMVPIINYKGQQIAYLADLIPSTGHIRPNYVMAYDIRPLDTMRERADFLEEAFKNDYTLFFEHDIQHECAKLKRDDRGRYSIDHLFDLKDLG
jgi:glyoxylase-like metal-dependent hydrolase (beta-lactamase superfamily II)